MSLDWNSSDVAPCVVAMKCVQYVCVLVLSHICIHKTGFKVCMFFFFLSDLNPPEQSIGMCLCLKETFSLFLDGRTSVYSSITVWLQVYLLHLKPTQVFNFSQQCQKHADLPYFANWMSFYWNALFYVLGYEFGTRPTFSCKSVIPPNSFAVPR